MPLLAAGMLQRVVTPAVRGMAASPVITVTIVIIIIIIIIIFVTTNRHVPRGASYS